MRPRPIVIATSTVVAGIIALAAYLMMTDTEHPLSATPSREVYPVAGIDISGHNGDSIDFVAASQTGALDFVLIKATEGTNFKDRNFRYNIERARQAGLKVGAYHFFRFDSPGYMQGLNFLNSVRGQKLDLPLVIDIEEWANPREYNTETIVGNLRRLISHLERHGYRVMLYTNKDGFERFIKGRLESYPLWLCTFSTPPAEIDWVIWQYSHRGSLDGIKSKVDLNVFNGSPADWRRWLGIDSTGVTAVTGYNRPSNTQ